MQKQKNKVYGQRIRVKPVGPSSAGGSTSFMIDEVEVVDESPLNEEAQVSKKPSVVIPLFQE